MRNILFAAILVTPFGRGYIIDTPGQPPTTVTPFGRGAIIDTPGEMPTTVLPFGKGFIINDPNVDILGDD